MELNRTIKTYPDGSEMTVAMAAAAAAICVATGVVSAAVVHNVSNYRENRRYKKLKNNWSTEK